MKFERNYSIVTQKVDSSNDIADLIADMGLPASCWWNLVPESVRIETFYYAACKLHEKGDIENAKLSACLYQQARNIGYECKKLNKETELIIPMGYVIGNHNI
jgi:hypothetical protein|tara:strand:- start:147 stop:455 length:309 start_codon:yes stop_codon:yes gene_type:complete